MYGPGQKTQVARRGLEGAAQATRGLNEILGEECSHSGSAQPEEGPWGWRFRPGTPASLPAAKTLAAFLSSPLRSFSFPTNPRYSE